MVRLTLQMLGVAQVGQSGGGRRRAEHGRDRRLDGGVPRRYPAFLIGILAAIALVMAAIGIRIAVGAQRGDILRLVVGQGMGRGDRFRGSGAWSRGHRVICSSM